MPLEMARIYIKLLKNTVEKSLAVIHLGHKCVSVYSEPYTSTDGKKAIVSFYIFFLFLLQEKVCSGFWIPLKL